MLNQFSRTELLIGKDGIEKLKNAKVAVFGIGGVGSYTVEALARAGIGHLIIVDPDKYDVTNINRQIGAMHSTIGKYKVEVMKERLLDINPDIKIDVYKEFFLHDDKGILDNTVNYIIDAIDTITAKIELIISANKLNIPIISSMGTANKLDPTKFEVSDIYKTSVCPVCKILRKELKKRDIQELKVVYSKEIPKKSKTDEEETLGSISYAPSVAGLIIAGEVVKDIITNK